MTIKEFLILSDIASNAKELLEQMEKIEKPFSVCHVQTPESLNSITIGQLIKLQSISNSNDLFLIPSRILLGLNDEKILKTDAIDIIGFSQWVAKEVQRINKLFESTNTPPTPEEKKAGIESLSFGLFGLIDYYAIRMGITDHEEVENVPWIRVYKCLDMDAKKVQFERRLRTIISQKK